MGLLPSCCSYLTGTLDYIMKEALFKRGRGEKEKQCNSTQKSLHFLNLNSLPACLSHGRYFRNIAAC